MFGLCDMFRNLQAVLRPLVHPSFHCRFIAWWMAFALADLRLGFLAGLILCIAASLAASSAFSFPSIPLCPGTHSSCSSYDGLVSYNVSISSRIRLMIDCPDCRFGFASDLIADW